MIAGFIIGAFAVLPGVSGGVVAVLLGVYQKIIEAFNNFKCDKKNNVVFLTKTAVGVLIGVVLSSKILLKAFNLYYGELCYLFIGLILGTIPYFIKDCNKDGKFELNYITIFISLAISLIISIYFKNRFIYSISNNFMSLLLSGILFAFGKIIPGISSSVLLNMIGKYEFYLELFSNPVSFINGNFKECIVIVFGVVLGILLSIKICSYMLKNYYSKMCNIILGFILSSLVIMYPNSVSITGILCLILGFCISFDISKIKIKK